MIRQLQIENFRCLRSVTIDLEPLTVFVGANASGKSSVFAALCDQMSAEDRFRRDVTLRTMVEVSGPRTQPARRTMEPGIAGMNVEGDFPECVSLQLEPGVLRLPNHLYETHRIERNGTGMTNLFATLTREQQSNVVAEFCRLVPMFSDVNLRPLGAGTHRILFQDRWQKSLQYEPNAVSDGSILVFCYLLLSHQSPPPAVICIEEPERGLHPYLMRELIAVLRGISSGAIGPRSVQVLLATHSAELLEFVEPKEVRFFRRTRDTGETIVEKAPLDDPSWLNTLKTYDQSLGDLWLSGGLGGVPGR